MGWGWGGSTGRKLPSSCGLWERPAMASCPDLASWANWREGNVLRLGAGWSFVSSPISPGEELKKRAGKWWEALKPLMVFSHFKSKLHS